MDEVNATYENTSATRYMNRFLARVQPFSRDIRGFALFTLGAIAIHAALSIGYQVSFVEASLLGRADAQFRDFDGDLRVLVLGDSHARYGLDPQVLGNAFNFATADEGYMNSYYKLRHILTHDRREIEIVILAIGLHSFEPSRADTTFVSYWSRYIDFIEWGERTGNVKSGIVRAVRGALFPYLGESSIIFNYFDARVF